MPDPIRRVLPVGNKRVLTVGKITRESGPFGEMLVFRQVAETPSGRLAHIRHEESMSRLSALPLRDLSGFRGSVLREMGWQLERYV